MEVFGKVEVSLHLLLGGSKKSAARACHFHTQKEHSMSNNI